MSDYGDLVNLCVAIKRQADRVGVEHEDVHPIGVVVRIADIAASVVDWAGSKGRADAQRDATIGFIDQTVYANEDNRPDLKWTNAEVMELLGNIRELLVDEEALA
ncbi:hypothetical protein RS84_00228 [Microbacterium hydrocarbonoxydans]|uniref:Uncharacterized protein n=1 Tax=Microbacterium hydrocarbonoxydans TaxID=273678 RepID=A0A0M2HX60_9MICO|nr:hypothetical protein [Microbacterium hydrocarbonoxydans]KJL49515.1 hypothetical protein RS84_00228 [Microbacterium hydrocarbonoxydans]